MLSLEHFALFSTPSHRHIQQHYGDPHWAGDKYEPSRAIRSYYRIVSQAVAETEQSLTEQVARCKTQTRRDVMCVRACAWVSLCESQLLSSGGFWTVCDPERKPQFDVNDVCSQPLHTSSELVAVLSNTSATEGRVKNTTSHLPVQRWGFTPCTRMTFFNFLWLFRESVAQKHKQTHNIICISPPLCTHSHKGQSTSVSYRSFLSDNIQHGPNSKHLGWRRNIN